MVLTMLEQAAQQGQNLVVKAVHEEDHSSNTSVIAKLQQTSSTQNLSSKSMAFQCPYCPLKVSFALRRNHLTKHFYAQLSAEIATNSQCSDEPPYCCYLCRHIGN